MFIFHSLFYDEYISNLTCSAWSRTRKGGWAIAQSPILTTTITLERLALYYSEQLKRGKNGKAAIVKVARKLLSRIRYVWLSGEAYQTAIVK